MGFKVDCQYTKPLILCKKKLRMLIFLSEYMRLKRLAIENLDIDQAVFISLKK